MLTDAHGRSITYLRVSVTDRCNYRCLCCMPPDGVALRPRSDILDFERITAVTGVAGSLGFRKIKIAGGEPLVRKGLDRLVGMIAGQGWYDDIGMTTNGALLDRGNALSLKAAGLGRVNVSLDTLDPVEFVRITRGGSIQDVLNGIDAARSAGLTPIKVNMIIFTHTRPEEIGSMREFCRREGLVLQTIAHYTLSDRSEAKIAIKTERPYSCSDCSRLRLTADGHLKSCLHSDEEIRVDWSDITGSLRRAVAAKPGVGTSCNGRVMNQIGG